MSKKQGKGAAGPAAQPMDVDPDPEPAPEAVVGEGDGAGGGPVAGPSDLQAAAPAPDAVEDALGAQINLDKDSSAAHMNKSMNTVSNKNQEADLRQNRLGKQQSHRDKTGPPKKLTFCGTRGEVLTGDVYFQTKITIVKGHEFKTGTALSEVGIVCASALHCKAPVIGESPMSDIFTVRLAIEKGYVVALGTARQRNFDEGDQKKEWFDTYKVRRLNGGSLILWTVGFYYSQKESHVAAIDVDHRTEMWTVPLRSKPMYPVFNSIGSFAETGVWVSILVESGSTVTMTREVRAILGGVRDYIKQEAKNAEKAREDAEKAKLQKPAVDQPAPGRPEPPITRKSKLQKERESRLEPREPRE